MTPSQRKCFWLGLVCVISNTIGLAAHDVGSAMWVVGLFGFCTGLAGLLLAASCGLSKR